jgi:hypothetical protein
MSELQTSITPEELQQIHQFKNQISSVIYAIGENRIRKEMLLNSYRNVEMQQQEFITGLIAKYNNGIINIETGEVSYAENSGNSESVDIGS